MGQTIAHQETLTPDKVVSRLSEWFRRMTEAGLTLNDLQMPIDDPAMRERLTAYWKTRAFQPTVSQLRAQEIMGPHFLGIGAVMEHLRVKFDNDQLGRLAPVPFGDAELASCHSTHVLVAGYPLRILDLYDLDKAEWPRSEHVNFGLHYSDWRTREWFACRERVDVRWYLLGMEALPGTAGLAYTEQVKLLPPNEEVPRTCEAAYAAYLFWKATGRFLFTEVDVRCRDENFNGRHATVGARQTHSCIYLGDYEDGATSATNSPKGLAASRLPTPQRF